MKASNGFKKQIQSYLIDRAKTDILFKPMYEKDNKNIDDCIQYILETVKKSNTNAFAENEIFGMAIHYYEEDSIVVSGSDKSTRVVISSTSDIADELSDNDIEEEVNSTLTLTDKRKLNKIIEDDNEDKGLFD